MPDLAVRPVDPVADAPLLHRWVSAERAAFWGMREHSVEEVADVYGHIAEQAHLRAFLVTSADRPLALFQTYDPAVDEIGAFYDRRPGDVGLHLFLADDPARAGRTTEIVGLVLDALLAAPRVTRVVLEPDVRNERSTALIERLGGEPGPEVHVVLPYLEKDARFYFIDRGPGRPPDPGLTRLVLPATLA